MAITIEDQPYGWSPRGQKLMIVASSTETAQDGFRYGISITNSTTSKTYQFLLPPSIDGRMYFDLQSLVQLRNNEDTTLHSHLVQDVWTETGGAWNLFGFNVSEYWIVAGVLTQNPESDVAGTNITVINGYYQVSDGYKPSANAGVQAVKYSLTSIDSYLMSDRTINTVLNRYLVGPSANNVFIPVREEDYGMMFLPANDSWLTSNDTLQYRIILYDSAYDSHIGSFITIPTTVMAGLPIYPANINADDGYDVKPSDFPHWKYYRVNVKGSSGAQTSMNYIFFNACEFNLCDCNFENIRLGWVNSRSGWDYFNFSKRSEATSEIDRKIYRRNLFNNTPTIFNSYDRGLYQRENLVQRTMSITSNYIQQGEFTLLRSLLVSNQVHWIHDDGTFTPINIDDTSFTEKNTADGKLYNVTLKIRMANEYWS